MVKQKKCLMILVLIILSLFIIATIPSYSMASNPIDDPNSYKPDNIMNSDATTLVEKIKPIINIISIFGIIVSIITLIILGIKYMVGSVQEKAEYKKSMIPYLIGAVLLFSGSTIISIIYNLIQNTNLAN